MGNTDSHHHQPNHHQHPQQQHSHHLPHINPFGHNHTHGNMWNSTGAGGSGYNLDWEYASNGQVPANAVIGGRDANGEQYFVGRARHEGSWLMPGKVQPSHGCIYYPYHGEKKSSTYEVLVNRTGREHLNWVQAANGTVPPNAVLCGHQDRNEQTYIGRHWHEGALVIGKVQPSKHCLYIPYGGREVEYRDYEILVSNETPMWNPNTFMGSGYVNTTNMPMTGGPPINPWGGGGNQQQNTYGNASAPVNPYGGVNVTNQPPPFNPNFNNNPNNNNTYTNQRNY